MAAEQGIDNEAENLGTSARARCCATVNPSSVMRKGEMVVPDVAAVGVSLDSRHSIVSSH